MDYTVELLYCGHLWDSYIHVQRDLVMPSLRVILETLIVYVDWTLDLVSSFHVYL